MRVPQILAALCITAATAFAAPPVVTLPAEVAGEVSAFVTVRATVTAESKGVKYVPIDAGLSVFPSDLLTDKTVTVVVASKPGRYRVLAYSGNGDGPSEPAQTVVVIGGAVKPPPVDPVPPPTGEVYYFAVIRADQATKEIADAMRLPAWDDVRKAGHLVKDIPLSELPSGIARPTTLPVLVTLRQNSDGKTWTPIPGTKPMPTTDAQVRELIK